VADQAARSSSTVPGCPAAAAVRHGTHAAGGTTVAHATPAGKLGSETAVGLEALLQHRGGVLTSFSTHKPHGAAGVSYAASSGAAGRG
jgi:hypothetical protein